MSLRIFLLAVGLLAILLSVKAIAQENDIDDDIEDMIEQSRSGEAVRELQAQVNAHPPQTDNRRELAIFYHKRGIANARLGNYDRTVDDLRLALENSKDNRPAGEGWGGRYQIQAALGLALQHRGDRFAAIDTWNVLAQSMRQSDNFRYLAVQLRLMRAYTALGQWVAADKARQEAETTLPRLRNTPRWERAQDQYSQMTGANFAQQGNYREAERSYRVSLESAEKFLQAMQRKLGSGDRRLDTALHKFTVAKSHLAEILSTQGKYGEAEAYARAGLDGSLTQFGFNTLRIGNALDVVGWTRFQQGDVAAAEKYYRAALAAVEGAGVAPYAKNLAARRAALANALLVQGRWNDALMLFEERAQGLRSDDAESKRGSRVVGWAYALHKTGQSERAAEMVSRATREQLRRPVSNRWHLAQLRGVLGMTLAATGKTGEALRAFRDSIPDLIRRDYDDSTDEDIGYWRAFWHRVILEAYLELLATLQVSGEAVPGLDLINESFWVADVARDSSVQEAITAAAARGQLPDRNLTELARQEQDGLNRIVALNRILSGLAGSTDERVAKTLSGVRAEVERLRREHVRLRADIRKQHPEYAELIDPRPVGIGDVRKALAPGEALVSIYLGESQSYVWTIVSGDRAVFRVVPLKREEFERDVRELRKAVDFGEGNVAQLRPFDLVLAHKVYRAFFEPDEALWKDAKILNVIPHGALGELPFALLVTAPSQQPPAGAQSAYADVPWLIRKAAIAQLPSANAFAALRRNPPGKAQRQPFVGFGDPLFTAEAGAGASRTVVRNLVVRKVLDTTEVRLNEAMRGGREPQAATAPTATLSQTFAQLSALPDTSDELREIAATLKADPDRDLFLSRQATEKNVKQVALDTRRVVAFATHGIAPGELTGLDQPALVLSNPALTGDSDNDGFLTMEEVLGLKLDADWVVLSACNTGSADGKGSEAVSGLGRAFFYAGARSLLVSNWAVETTSARLLTTELFKRQTDNSQLTRAEALRQSMLDLMGKKASAGFSYAHPAFWAPFSLVGDGGR